MMKISADIAQSERILAKRRFTVFSELVKARLTTLVLLTTAVGFYMGSAPG